MRPLKNFDEFIKNGIVRKQTPDIDRAQSLIKESEKSSKFLNEVAEKIGINNENANNIIKNTYDIIMELIRARMFTEGFNTSGYGAHEAEVSFLRKIGFPENEVQLINQLRYFRNGIMYYGKSFDSEYAKKVLNLLKSIKSKLVKNPTKQNFKS